MLCSGGLRGSKGTSPPECVPEKVHDCSRMNRTLKALVPLVLIMKGSERAGLFRNYPPQIAMLKCHLEYFFSGQFELPTIAEPCRPPLSAVRPASYVRTASVLRLESQRFHP
jgi:hypothetical protein